MAATNEEQLEIATKLNQVVEKMARTLDRIEGSYQNQVNTVERLAGALGQVNVDKSTQELGKLSNGLKDVIDKLRETGAVSDETMQELSKKLGEASSASQTLTGRMTDFGRQVSSTSKQGGADMGDFNDRLAKTIESADGIGDAFSKASKMLKDRFLKGVTVTSAGILGLAQGFKNLVALTKVAFGGISGLSGALFNLGASILSIPLKIFTGIVDMAANADMGSTDLMQAIEDLRKELGNLKESGSKAVMDTWKTMKGFTETGLSTWRVFGDLAERLRAVTAVAKGMGATWQVLNKQFVDGGGYLLAYQKGLGFADEDMQALGAHAITTGKPMNKILLDLTKQTLALGKAFDIDQKVIGRDVAKALKDVRHFGQLTVKEIAQASVYAKKLGVELDKITGTLDQFETFDQAAESTSKLSQAFGVQLDAFQLMEAQNPAEQIEMLRKQFRAAGVDSSSFTRQQLKLLTTNTGLDEQTARSVFSLKNQGVSLDDVKKKSEAAAKKTMTQTEAMQGLAASIERMVKPSQTMLGGFFDMFMAGMKRGMETTSEFRRVMMNIRISLMAFWRAGFDVGRMVVKIFPGVKELLGGLADFFQPAKFRKLAREMVGIFRDVFEKLTSGKFSFKAMMEQLRLKFFNFFNIENPAAKKMLSGFKKVTTAMATFVGEGIKWVAEKLSEGVKWIADIISGRKSLNLTGAAAGGKGALGFLGEMLAPIVKGLKAAWPMLLDAGKQLLIAVWNKIVDFFHSDTFAKYAPKVGVGMAAILFGPAVGKMIIAGLTQAVGSWILQGIANAIRGKAVQKAAESASGAVLKVGEKITKTTTKTGLDGMTTTSTVTKEAGTLTGAAKWGVSDAVKLGLKLVALAGALAAGGIMLAYAIVHMKKTFDAGGIKSIEDAELPLVTLAAVAVASIPLALALKLVGNVAKPSDLIKGGVTLVLAVGAVGAVAAGLTWLMKQAGDPAQIAAAGNIMLKMSLVFLMMVPLLIAAGVLGAIVTGPQAPFILAAAGIGMGVIVTAVGGMAAAAFAIVKALASLPIETGFKEKVDAFLGIMKVMNEFTSLLVKVIDLATPSFTSLILGGPKFDKSMKAATDAFTAMSGTIQDLMNTTLSIVKKISIGGKKTAQAAQVFGSIMQGVTGLMHALTPSDELIKESNSFIDKLLDPNVNVMNDVANQMSRMKDQILIPMMKEVAALMPVIAAAARQTAGAGEANLQAVAQLFSTVTELIKALVPPPEVMKEFGETTTTKLGLISGLEKNVRKFDAKGLENFVSMFITKFRDLVPVLIGKGGILDVLGNMAKTMKPDQIEAAKSLGGILSAVAQLVAGLAEAGKANINIDVSKVKSGTQVTNYIQQLNLGETIEGIGKVLPDFVTALSSAVKNVPPDKGFKSKMETAKTLFEIIAEIPKLLDFISQLPAGGEKGKEILHKTDPLVEGISAIAVFFQRIVAGGGAFGTGKSPLVDLMDQLDDKAFKRLTGSSNKIKASMDTLSSIIGSAKTMIEATDVVIKAAKEIETSGLGTTVETIGKIVETATKLDDALTNKQLNKIDIPARLKTLAKGVGLGASGRYEIENKPVNITINMTVTMNADDLETALVMRANSLIRDRLNFATVTEPTEKASQGMIPETKGPWQKATK